MDLEELGQESVSAAQSDMPVRPQMPNDNHSAPSPASPDTEDGNAAGMAMTLATPSVASTPAAFSPHHQVSDDINAAVSSLPGHQVPVETMVATHKPRYFHLDIDRTQSDGTLVPLGVKLDVTSNGLKVYEIKPQSPICNWNSRCALTFPDDAVQIGDTFIQVNDTRLSNEPQHQCEAMINELREAKDLFIVVCRNYEAKDL